MGHGYFISAIETCRISNVLDNGSSEKREKIFCRVDAEKLHKNHITQGRVPGKKMDAFHSCFPATRGLQSETAYHIPQKNRKNNLKKENFH